MYKYYEKCYIVLFIYYYIMETLSKQGYLNNNFLNNGIHVIKHAANTYTTFTDWNNEVFHSQTQGIVHAEQWISLLTMGLHGNA